MTVTLMRSEGSCSGGRTCLAGRWTEARGTTLRRGRGTSCLSWWTQGGASVVVAVWHTARLEQWHTSFSQVLQQREAKVSCGLSACIIQPCTRKLTTLLFLAATNRSNIQPTCTAPSVSCARMLAMSCLSATGQSMAVLAHRHPVAQTLLSLEAHPLLTYACMHPSRGHLCPMRVPCSMHACAACPVRRRPYAPMQARGPLPREPRGHGPRAHPEAHPQARWVRCEACSPGTGPCIRVLTEHILKQSGCGAVHALAAWQYQQAEDTLLHGSAALSLGNARDGAWRRGPPAHESSSA